MVSCSNSCKMDIQKALNGTKIYTLMNPFRYKKLAEKMKTIRQEISAASKQFKEKYPIFKHQNAIGLSLHILSTLFIFSARSSSRASTAWCAGSTSPRSARRAWAPATASTRADGGWRLLAPSSGVGHSRTHAHKPPATKSAMQVPQTLQQSQ